MTDWPKTREEAQRLGLIRYHTGLPCSKGHIADRYVCNNDCYVCTMERRARITARKREQYQAARRAKYEEDPEYRARVNARNKANREANRDETNAARRERYWSDPDYREKYLAYRRAQPREYHRNGQLKVNYGITLEEYNAMLAAQGGVCALCGSTDGKTLHVDHCHGSKKVRSLLCNNCNRGLGCFKDDPDLMRKAADYLEKWRGC